MSIERDENGVKTLNIQIVAFPPFKLRSNLIDKDPVIWQHLLEDYITLFQKLIIITNSKNLKLSVKTQQQLSIFMKVYLFETSEESTKIFSLGSINPDIIINQKKLKLIVFQFIKCYNLINLKIAGDSIWCFTKIYTKLAYENQSINQSLISVNIVKNLIEGTIKSNLNSKSNDISLIKLIHDYLQMKISETKLDKIDLETLVMLLGQKNKKTVTNSSKQRQIGKRSNTGGSNTSADFCEKFVNSYWIQILETLYNRGESLHSKTCFETMLISLISLPSTKIAKLLQSDLNLNNKTQLVKLFPLVSKIVLSKKFMDLNPDLSDKLSFLRNKKNVKGEQIVFDPVKIRNLLDFFPQMTEGQCKTLLTNNEHNVELIINQLFENPDIVGTTKEYVERTPKQKKTKGPKVATTNEQQSQQYGERSSKYSNNDISLENVQFGKKEFNVSSAITNQDLKKKTLENALRLLYESDEDEPDDTYDDQELTKGDTSKTPKFDKDDAFDTQSNSKDAELEKIELKLFQIYKADPVSLSRTGRDTNHRKQLKNQLKWTDEQIEGWSRMLEKNPRRFKLLDEKFIDVNSSLNSGTKKSTRYRRVTEDDEDEDRRDTSNNKRKGGYIPKVNNSNPKPPAAINDSSKEGGNKPVTPTDKRKQQLKNKNKAVKANHNRKAGHDKKMTKSMP